MDEHDDLIELAAIEAAPGATGVRTGRQRLRIVAAFVVGLVAGTSGLATAGALPDGAQEVAHRTLGAAGINVPHGDRYWGQECAGEAKKNHGQYVRSQPKDKRAEAAASRCGKPVGAGAGDDDPAGAGTGASCQGPPSWAGKGKPDDAAKKARKQACGDSDDKGRDEATPGPSTQAEPTVPLTSDPAGVTTSTTELPAKTTTTTLSPTTDTTATTATTVTTLPSITTSTTAGSDGPTTPSLPVEPAAGS